MKIILVGNIYNLQAEVLLFFFFFHVNLGQLFQKYTVGFSLRAKDFVP